MKAVSLKGRVPDFLGFCEHDIRDCFDAIKGHAGKRRYEDLAYVTSSGIEACFRKAGMLLRVRGDEKGADEACETAVDFAELLRDAVKSAAQDAGSADAWMYSSNFVKSFLACMLARAWPLLEDLASAMYLPPVRHEEGGVRHFIPKLYATTIRDDMAAFLDEYRRFNADRPESLYFEREYFVHDELMRSIIGRDSHAFNQQLKVAEERYLARAKDRKLGNVHPGWGGLQYNQLAFDYQAAALGNLAIHKGLEVTFKSEVIPIARN